MARGCLHEQIQVNIGQNYEMMAPGWTHARLALTTLNTRHGEGLSREARSVGQSTPMVNYVFSSDSRVTERGST